MKRSKLISVVVDKVVGVIVGLLFFVSFGFVPLLVSFHFYRHDDIRFLLVDIFLMISVALLWLGLARWLKWPAEKYAKAIKTDTELKPPAA